MRKMFLDGELVGTSQQIIPLTQAEYDNLSTEEKLNGDAYFIKDSNDNESVKIENIETAMGDVSKLSTLGYENLVEALTDVYQRLGNMSFSMDTDNKTLNVQYDNTTPTPVDIPTADPYMSDAKKIERIETIFGDSDSMGQKGFSNLVDMILDIHSRIDGLSFKYNEETGGVDVTVETNE